MPAFTFDTREEIREVTQKVYNAGYSDGYASGMMTGALLSLVILTVGVVMLDSRGSQRGDIVKL